ncbi:MAG: hypothetical protein J6A22_01790 [Bacteroidales bacterium]|nr:hypothetical protein [Bacteroidales bacterium]
MKCISKQILIIAAVMLMSVSCACGGNENQPVQQTPEADCTSGDTLRCADYDSVYVENCRM